LPWHRHVASTRLVPQANRLGLAWYSQAENALVPRMRKLRSDLQCEIRGADGISGAALSGSQSI
jgi:hypothetical protein